MGVIMEPQLWIDGAWADGAARMVVINPATGQQYAEVVDASRDDVDRAVQAAHTAFYDGRWSRLTPGERSKALWKLADLLEERAEEFARAESENTGKPYKFLSLGGDIPFAVDNLRFFAAAARDTHGARAGEFAAGYTSMFRREPVGVVGQIAPWNYPLMMAIWKIGQALVEHPAVRMVSLTGSTNTGKQIMRTAAETLKRVHLELGGKAPFIIFDDADVELVAGKAAFAATMNTGQDCTAATRVYVAQNRVKQVQEALVAAMRAVKIGAPFDDDTEMGPLISGVQRERVQGFVERARAAGARILTGGGVPGKWQQGYYYEPTVITNVDQHAEIVQSEVFGPVITVSAFKDDAEALRFGNDVLYGLAASVWTNDIGRAMQLSSQLEFGTVWINDHLPLASEGPHGGFKQSGFGKDMSVEAVGDYQITKHVMIKV